MSSSPEDREQAIIQLHDIARALMRSESPMEIADTAVRAFDDVLDEPYNGVYFYDEQAHQLRPVSWTAEGEALVGEIPSFGPGDSLAWNVFESNQTQMYADVGSVPGALNPDSVIGSEIILPLNDHGVVLIGSDETHAFDESDVSLAQIVASHMTTALDRIEQEQALRRQNERLDEFASVVSHDVRNPLNIARGRIRLAQDDCNSEHLNRAAAAVERSIELIDELGKLALEGEHVGELEVVSLEATAESGWLNVESEDATLRVETDRMVRASPSRLKQLLENLFRNAVDHGGADTKVVIGDMDNGFYVADDGPGISRDARNRVFETGYTTNDENMGYGLSIVRDIATAHGWAIGVTGSKSGGARFEITEVDTIQAKR